MKIYQYGCCDFAEMIDFSKLEFQKLVNIYNSWVISAAIFIAICPVINNLLARVEYHRRFLTKCTSGPKHGVHFFAAITMLLALHRDYCFYKAIQVQPSWYILQQNWILWTGFLLILFGSSIIYSAAQALGFYAFFMGEYFGLFLNKRPTDFPFTVCRHPVYTGSIMTFIGVSLVFASQAGLMLSVLNGIVLTLAGSIEIAFLDDVYKSLSHAYGKTF